MLRFYRQIRQRLLAEKKISKYVVYVIVEVFIVIIGILIAIQVDNWNEERVHRKQYEFGILQLHSRIQARFLYWDTYSDRAEYHLAVIDSLLKLPDSIPKNRLLGNLLVLDNWYNEDWMDEAWFLDYLDFNPTDPIQFEVAENLRRYLYGGFKQLEKYMLEEETMREFLIEQNIPVCEIGLGSSYRDFVKWCGGKEFSGEYHSMLLELIASKQIRSRLQQLKLKRKTITSKENGWVSPEVAVLEVLEKHYEFLPKKFEHLEMVGTGTMAKNWSTGFKMTPLNPEHTVWECKDSLNDGWIKFRTDDNWTFSWGNGELNPNKLVFGGPNIPVMAGNYHVIIDIENNTFELKPN